MRALQSPPQASTSMVAGDAMAGEMLMGQEGLGGSEGSTPPVGAESPFLDGGQADDDGKVAGGWAYVVAAAVPFAFAVFFIRESVGLGLGTMSAPGPGLWPFALSVTLAALTVVLLVGWHRFGPCEAWGAGAVWMLIGAASVAPFILLTPQVGFELPALALLVFWFKVLGHESLLLSVIVATCSVAVLHVLFVEVLGTSIPTLFGI